MSENIFNITSYLNDSSIKISISPLQINFTFIWLILSQKNLMTFWVLFILMKTLFSPVRFYNFSFVIYILKFYYRCLGMKCSFSLLFFFFLFESLLVCYLFQDTIVSSNHIFQPKFFEFSFILSSGINTSTLFFISVHFSCILFINLSSLGTSGRIFQLDVSVFKFISHG